MHYARWRFQQDLALESINSTIDKLSSRLDKLPEEGADPGADSLREELLIELDGAVREGERLRRETYVAALDDFRANLLRAESKGEL